ncbi:MULTISPECIES: hypothetical protein [unclassified Polaromonas]|uniref:hypothetical protein n=1 Tax=unclassified Polaromonas TaxID=2638319 RepID=UPI0025DFA79F|nr:MULTISPECIES: hypothetical protein [unclassified Polaromonas]HQR98125.1 hypothetical protein [Polaromonas sp.]HQS88085.1 hypothetical protein [Polaromonas sp.]
MQTFWITFTDGSQACSQGQSEYDAKAIAEKLTGKTVGGGKYQNFDMKPLPYPAEPVVWRFEHPLHGKTPTFCHAPKQCAGRTACPQNYSCTE